MWQMEVWRHISAGRLAEMFGASQLDTDKFIRTLGWRVAAAARPRRRRAGGAGVLDAYTAGVNAWLDGHRGSLGLAFLAAGVTPEPWTDLDTVAWGKVQAWNLGGNFDSEVFRYLADAKLGDPARTDELFPAYREDAPVITPTGLPGSGGAGAHGPAAVGAGSTAIASAKTPRPIGPAEAAAWRSIAGLGQGLLQTAGLDAADGLASDHGIGSNDWVVGPGMSQTGGALLANDPHLGISMPSIWFINGLHCRTVSDACPYDVAGVSFPGVPGVVLGHNARIAWGATNIDPDVQDLVIETVDPADPNALPPRWGVHPVRRSATNRSRCPAADPFDLEVRSTVHGPILNDVDERLKDAPPMALRWTANLEPDRTLEAILGLNTAASFQDFRESLSLYGAPAQNFVYADVDGHIGYQFPGYVPIRSNPDDRGDRPVRGDDGSGEWTGRIPFDDLPWQFDPEDGVIVTANNAAVDADYPHFVGPGMGPGLSRRAHPRPDRPLRRRRPDRRRDEPDPVRRFAARAARTSSRCSRKRTPATDDGTTIATRISDWDGACDRSSLGCAAFNAGSTGSCATSSTTTWARWPATTSAARSRGCCCASSSTIRTRRGGTTAGRRASPRPRTRSSLERWTRPARSCAPPSAAPTAGRGDASTPRPSARRRSAPAGSARWSGTSTRDRAPCPGPPGPSTTPTSGSRRAYPDPTDPDYVPVGIDHVFDMTNMPSYRLTIDMRDLDGARLIITTGQSGNPFDRHYNDQIEPWIGR